MRTIIAGSRSVTDGSELLVAVTESGFDITEVVSGGAGGADKLGEAFAGVYGLPLKLFPAKWHAHGKAAGPIRNREMAAYADALIALWDGQSPGTRNMIDEAKASGLRVHVRIVAPPHPGREEKL